LKPKKKGKQILLVEQSKEIEILRKKNEELRQERANCNAQIEKLKQELETNKAVINALQTSNDKEKADYETRIETKMHELETNKTEIKALQVSNNKLKEEVDALKATNNSLKTINDKLVEELRLCKATVKTVGTNAEGLEMLEAGMYRYTIYVGKYLCIYACISMFAYIHALRIYVSNNNECVYMYEIVCI